MEQYSINSEAEHPIVTSTRVPPSKNTETEETADDEEEPDETLIGTSTRVA